MGSPADSTSAMMQLCAEALNGTSQLNSTTSGYSGLTSGSIAQRRVSSTKLHGPGESAPHVPVAGNVVLQKSLGSSGRLVVASVHSAVTRKFSRGAVPRLVTCTRTRTLSPRTGARSTIASAGHSSMDTSTGQPSRATLSTTRTWFLTLLADVWSTRMSVELHQ